MEVPWARAAANSSATSATTTSVPLLPADRKNVFCPDGGVTFPLTTSSSVGLVSGANQHKFICGRRCQTIHRNSSNGRGSYRTQKAANNHAFESTCFIAIHGYDLIAVRALFVGKRVVHAKSNRLCKFCFCTDRERQSPVVRRHRMARWCDNISVRCCHEKIANRCNGYCHRQDGLQLVIEKYLHLKFSVPRY